MESIAFTEHGNVLGWINKKRYSEEHGLKYIHGVEAYITEGLTDDIDSRVYDNFHVILLARNYEGVKEINKLLSQASVRSDVHTYEDMSDVPHYYYQPRITYKDLKGTSDNILITTACLGGILNNGSEKLQKDFVNFMTKNKDRCFLEIQHHSVADQISYNKKLLDISKQTGIRLVSGTDTHSLTDVHERGRDVLQKSKGIHFANEDNWDLIFKSYDELVLAYGKQNSLPREIYLQAIENTNVIADMIEEFDLDYSFKYPEIHDNPKQELLRVVGEGIKWRGYKITPAIQKRIIHEIAVFEKNHMFDFILLDYDVKRWCRDNNIEYGEARGSISGSLVAYLIGITHIDPIKYNLVFERFVHDERIGLADIDSDYNPRDIPAIKEYLYDKHGLYCADIITYNTIALKGAIRDVGRAFDIPLNIINEICDNIESDENKYREEYPELFQYVDILQGTMVSVGSHPAAVCIADEDLASTLGVFYTKTNKYPILQIDMREAESLNYLKLDVLKLETMGIINDTCKVVGIDRLRDWNVDYSNTKIWDSMLDSTAMIFQWNGYAGESYYKKLFSHKNLNRLRSQTGNVDYIDLFSIGNAAIRPAGDSYRNDLANGVVPDYHNQQLNEFFEPTFRFVVYQEDIQNFLHEFCGFTLGQADMVRRGLAKKYGTEEFLPSIKEGFIKTMDEKYNMEQDEAEDVIISFLDVISSASDYAFSKNHSIAYSIIGFQTAYLRYHYPLEFITTNLNYADTEEKMSEILTYMNNHTNITLNPIKFGYSGADYRFDRETNSIYKGIASIKYLNEQVGNDLQRLGKDNKYNTFYDVMVDLTTKMSIDSRQLRILTTLNFFDRFGNNQKLLKYQEIFSELYGKKQLSKAKGEKLGLPEDLLKKYSRETPKTYMDFQFEGVLRNLWHDIEDTKLPLKEQIEAEKEYLSYIEFIEPRAGDNFYIVTEFKTYKNKNRPYITLYRLNNGETIKTKVVDGKFYALNPFKMYNLIRVDKFKTQKKNRLIDGKWQKIDETEDVLDNWQVF